MSRSLESPWWTFWEQRGSVYPVMDPIKLDGFDHECGRITPFTLEKLISKIQGLLELSAEDKLLEVGCGAGMLLRLLSKYCNVYGCDISSSLLKVCGEFLPNAMLLQCHANSIPLKDHSFDIILCHSVFQYFPDFQYVQETLDEFVRLANTRGIILIMDIPDIEKSEAILNHRALVKTSSKHKDESRLEHLFYPKSFFSSYCLARNLRYKIFEQDLEEYQNSVFRFNVSMNLGVRGEVV